MFRNSDHPIVGVLWHRSLAKKPWFAKFDKRNCPANRCGVYTRLQDHKNMPWTTKEELRDQINESGCDYVCLGNGNDDIGLWLQQKVQKKFLFSEYGWLPWKWNFYIDPKGVGAKSSLRHMSLDDMKSKDLSGKIWSLQVQLAGGELNLNYGKFVYVPLQVDTPTSNGKPDFKFQFTRFKNNQEFLKHVKSIVPAEYKILVKNHPSSRSKAKMLPGMIDISDQRIDKHALYSSMSAMLVINSTSVLEAMPFHKHIFTYGEDIFSGKDIVHENVGDMDRFNETLKSEPSWRYKIFLNELLNRQFERGLWEDKVYVKNHFWNHWLASA